jgi:hypothetical protein
MHARKRGRRIADTRSQVVILYDVVPSSEPSPYLIFITVLAKTSNSTKFLFVFADLHSVLVFRMKENSLYRSIKKQVRAKELLRQSRLPSSMQQRDRHMRHTRRSMSASEMTRTGLEECTFKPKTNGYYIPNYDRLHSKFLRETEEARRMRAPTQCEPFLLHTSMIPSRQERVLEDIRNDQEMRYLQSFQIKGKQLPTRSTSGMNLSANLQQPEAIPIKSTDVQRLRESMGKKKRREHEVRTKFEEKFQRARSAKEKRLKEGIQERAKLHDKSAIYRAKKEESVSRTFIDPTCKSLVPIVDS